MIERGVMKRRILTFLPRHGAVVITAALVAALCAGGTALAVKAFTKKQAKKIFVTKTVAENSFVKNNSAGVANAAGGLDLGPNYRDLASTQVTIKGGKILATANISLRDTNGVSINQVECFLRVGNDDIDHWVSTVQDTTGSRRPVYPLVGGTGNLSAGTYTVLLRCGEAGASTGVIEDSAHLVAWNG
jgi:hypothetical protein